MGGNLQRADLVLYAAVSQKEEGGAAIPTEMQVQRADNGLQGRLVNGSVLRNETAFHGEKGNAAVHGAAVQVKESEFFGHHFGKGTLPRGRKAVNSNNNVRNVHSIGCKSYKYRKILRYLHIKVAGQPCANYLERLN